MDHDQILSDLRETGVTIGVLTDRLRDLQIATEEVAREQVQKYVTTLPEGAFLAFARSILARELGLGQDTALTSWLRNHGWGYPDNGQWLRVYDAILMYWAEVKKS